jgi:hypothetical protein
MGEIVRFEADQDSALFVETDDDSFGIERSARSGQGVIEASQRLEDIIAKVKPAIREVVNHLKEMAPDEHEIEFGLKLNAEVGAVIAKTAADSHFAVRMKWRRVIDHSDTES